MHFGFDIYGGGFGGGTQQGVGGFATLNSFNATGNYEILRCCWNGSTLTTSLGMGTDTLTCGPVSASTGTFSDAVSCGGTLTCGTNSIADWGFLCDTYHDESSVYLLHLFRCY